MALVRIETFIKAPPDRVFDLSRSVDLHISSMKHRSEQAIAGVRTGLMKKDDMVTWTARHLLKKRTLTVHITDFEAPRFFADEMVEGDFEMMRHEHYFKALHDGTYMQDHFYFVSPFGLVGKLFDAAFLKTYMKRLLLERNKEIKRIAESNLWKQYLTS